MGLSTYKHKRNFKNTPEPSGSREKKNGKLSFVVQRHHASHLHYDFRLELEGVLKSWAVPKGPSMKAGEKRLAVMVEDHPLDYGDFYGEIPKGNYGAGTVDIWDNGTYTPLEKTAKSDAEKILLAQLKKGDLKFSLQGKHLKGAFALVQIKDGLEKNWLLIKKKDIYSMNDFNIADVDPVKPFSGKKKKLKPDKPETKTVSIKQKIVKKRLSDAWEHTQKPMLAKIAEKIPDGDGWLFEPKYDGYRALAKTTKGTAELRSRNGNSFSKQYDTLIQELSLITDDVILDGEVVIEDKKGVSNFQLLQNYTTTREGILKYYIFDILFVNGHSLTDIPLLQRKELLDSFFDGYTFTNILKSPVVTGNGEKLLQRLTKKGYEGIIAKESMGLYYPGKRSDGWLKIKSVMMQEVVICGYTLPQKSRKYFGSLILGVYKNDKLTYIGNCGTGFTDASLEELHKQFKKLHATKCPFPEKPVLTGPKGSAVWMKPALVCNVKFLQWTRDGHLRNPVFMGLRNDKKASEVIRENELPDVKQKEEADDETILTIGGKPVKCTNLSKVYWPDENITKGDLIDYYLSVSKWILPYLKNRPQSLNRHPNGITGTSFYQKDMNVDQLPSWVKTAKIYSKSNNKYLDYLLCNDAATLVYMANLGCIEINPWHSVYTNPDYPDYMILDLDPGKIDFIEVVNTALVIKNICDELKISCFCKTSGATGLHVYIPLGHKYDYDDVKIFAELMATLTHKRLPETTSIERTVSKRTHKIYVDFLQNRKGQTIAAPYSVRPKPHATVSAPLLWKEVNEKLTPEQFTIYNMQKRLEKVGDLWKGVLVKPVNLKLVLARIQKLL